MPSSGTSTFTDPDDYQASLDGTPHDILLVNTGGEFKARVTSARLHELYLVRSEEDFPRIAYVSLAPALALTGVSERTLRSCCTEFLGISPGRYVLLRRLKQARIALREADPATASVAKIARACGFTQLGRFSVVYQTIFGETPSATLRRLPGSELGSSLFAETA